MKKVMLLGLFYIVSVVIFGQTAEHFHTAIGSRVDSNIIQDIFGSFVSEPEILIFPESELLGVVRKERSFYNFRDEGVSFCFDDNSLLTAIFINGPRSTDNNFRQFSGHLPFNIRITFSRQEIENIMGRTDGTRTAVRYSISEWGNKYFEIRYHIEGKNGLVNYITISN